MERTTLVYCKGNGARPGSDGQSLDYKAQPVALFTEFPIQTDNYRSNITFFLLQVLVGILNKEWQPCYSFLHIIIRMVKLASNKLRLCINSLQQRAEILCSNICLAFLNHVHRHDLCIVWRTALTLLLIKHHIYHCRYRRLREATLITRPQSDTVINCRDHTGCRIWTDRLLICVLSFFLSVSKCWGWFSGWIPPVGWIDGGC